MPSVCSPENKGIETAPVLISDCHGVSVCSPENKGIETCTQRSMECASIVSMQP